MPKVFSSRTLGEFEDASASIPLRNLDRAFERVHVRLGDDPGGLGGSRRTQFRRYVASIDQGEPHLLNRLGDALGALIAEVATSKQDFLVQAAERDGFIFADGVFRPAAITPSSFAVTRIEDLALIDDSARRLDLLANESPQDAIAGAKQLVQSVCETVLRLMGEPAPTNTDLGAIVTSTLEIIEPGQPESGEGMEGAAIVRRCLRHIGAVVGDFDELRHFYASARGGDAKRKGLSPRHARVAVGTAVTFAGFVARTYHESGALKNVRRK